MARAEGGGRRRRGPEFSSSSLQQVPPPPAGPSVPVPKPPSQSPPTNHRDHKRRTSGRRAGGVRDKEPGPDGRRPGDQVGGEVWGQGRDIGAHGGKREVCRRSEHPGGRHRKPGGERGATGGVRARQTLKRKGGPGKRVTGSSGAWVSQVSRAPATWQTQELRYRRAGPKVESESEGH